MTIADGFYWVLQKGEKDWEVAHILHGDVLVTGTDVFYPLDEFEIGEKIEREGLVSFTVTINPGIDAEMILQVSEAQAETIARIEIEKGTI